MKMLRAMVAATLCCSMLGCAPEPESETRPEEAVEGTTRAVVDPIDEDVVVTVKNAFLTRVIDDAVTEKVIGAHLIWEPGAQKRVEVQRVDSNTYRVDLDLKTSGYPINPRVDVVFNVTLGCTWRDAKVTLDLTDADVNAIINDTLDTITLGRLDKIADDIADAKFKKVLHKNLVDHLELDIGEFCPLIEINNAGNTVLQFGRFNNCQDEGNTRTVACSGAFPVGSVQQLCVNGRWEVERRDCGVCNPGATKREACRGNSHGDVNYVCTAQRSWRRTTSFCEPNVPPGGAQP